MSLLVTSTARISSVCSSIPRWTFRQTRRFGPPCLRVRRENSPPDCFLILLTPLAFAFDLDPCAVDQEMQRALRPPMRDVHGQRLLATAQCAEVRHRPLQPNQPEQALDEPRRLSERQAEQNLHRQAGLDGRIAVDGLPPPLASRLSLPGHLGIKPDRQRAPALERLVVGRPVLGLVGRCVRSAHDPQLSRWIHEMNPLIRFVQQSPSHPSIHSRVKLYTRRS